MLEYYAELDVNTTKEELEQSINDHLLSDGYKRARSKKNKRYVRDWLKTVRDSHRTEFLIYRNSFEPVIEVGYWKGKIRLFYKYDTSVRIFMYIWLAMCLVLQCFLLIKTVQEGASFHILELAPTFMFLAGGAFAAITLYVTAKIRLSELKRAIRYSSEVKLKVKTLKQS